MFKCLTTANIDFFPPRLNCVGLELKIVLWNIFVKCHASVPDFMPSLRVKRSERVVIIIPKDEADRSLKLPIKF